MSDWKDFYGPNAGYLAELYERYRDDPASVDEQTRSLFQTWRPPTNGVPSVVDAPGSVAVAAQDPRLIVAASNYALAIRAYGHLGANLDPLGTGPHGDPGLSPETHGISEADLAALPASIVGGPVAKGAENALEAIQDLRLIYCGTIGYEFDHVHDAAERAWLRDAVEEGGFCHRHEVDERWLLYRLTQVEALERFLHRTYPGQKRFSIEGVDMLVPILDEAIGCASSLNVCEVVLAMAHRGRLNVLAHVLGKPYELVLSEFEGVAQKGIGPAEGSTAGWTGDVKYHLGARHAYHEDSNVSVVVTLAPNPSHLEFVNPVAEGMARASDDGREGRGAPKYYRDAALPILIHGDAAFSGQGVVAETLNFASLPGYTTSGTIHIITNNQLGFTADPTEFRSTHYASDLAKGFEIPIVHVNADDPLACVAAIRLANAYRQRFHKDFLIDLIGYRRWGHNEGDEPAFTQPRMYQVVRSHPTVRELWVKEMIRREIITQEEADGISEGGLRPLQEARNRLLQNKDAHAEAAPSNPIPLAEDRPTAVDADKLVQLNQELCRLPEGFKVNKRLQAYSSGAVKLSVRRAALTGLTRRALAFASILADGTSHSSDRPGHRTRHFQPAPPGAARPGDRRHVYAPLRRLPFARASFAVYNSPLTESATLGFEYGYSIHAPGAMVLWEAQYGDFANGGQVIIDQFIVSGWSKWQQKPSLVLLLPHGFEGQGPEHSSARLERFPAAGGRGQRARRQLHHGGPVLPPAALAGGDPAARAQAAHRDDAKEPAASAAGRLPLDDLSNGIASSRCSTTRRRAAERRRSPASSCAAARSTTTW
jgi:2-oxoglutarate dehydrogenase E1 component